MVITESPAIGMYEKFYGIEDLRIEDYRQHSCDHRLEDGHGNPQYFFDRYITFRKDGQKYALRLESRVIKRVRERRIWPIATRYWSWEEDHRVMAANFENIVGNLLAELERRTHECGD